MKFFVVFLFFFSCLGSPEIETNSSTQDVLFHDGIQDMEIVDQDMAIVDADTSSDSAPDVTRDATSHKFEWVSPVFDVPNVEERRFHSKTINEDINYHVFLPDAYHTHADKRFPVLYYLHGSGSGSSFQAGGSKGLIELVVNHYSQAIHDKKIPPMIIVFPNGLTNGMWCDSKRGKTPIETIFVEDIIPHVDDNFRTLKNVRTLSGFSMGGYGSSRLGFKYPNLFSAISLVGGGPLQQVFSREIGPSKNADLREFLLRTVYGNDQNYFKEQSPWYLAEVNKANLDKLKIMQIVGDKDMTLPANQALHEHLNQLNIVHEYLELPNVGHNPKKAFDALKDNDSYWTFFRSSLEQSP